MSSDAEVKALSEQGRRAMEQGRPDEAARIWERLLTLSPDHPRAVFHLGQHALYRRDGQKAVQLLRRAVSLNPGDAVVALNLSFACRAAGDADGELQALDAALGADPYFIPALLAKGAALEKFGKTRAAAQVYRNVLTIAPPDDYVPAELRPAIARARVAVKENTEALETFLSERLPPSGEASEAFEEAKAILIGTKRAFVQQPMILHFPRLPAIPFYNRADFPWIAELEAATDIIREELLGLLKAQSESFKPYLTRPQGEQNRYAAKWKAFFLYFDGEVVPENCDLCPQTAALLKQLPMANVPGAAPTAFFSALEPQTAILPHTGVTNTRLVVHLPLIVPGECWFRVGNERREWRLGEALIFDDTIEHEAHNNSGETRFVLIFDIWNPYLSERERHQVSDLMGAVLDYNKD
jgi:aspartyl/asparaginyl beta-hydroxylase (cupin superfamily)/Flp pilus assembly protein TadD